MTAYFDSKQSELRGLADEEMEDFEQRIIQDVANVGELLVLAQGRRVKRGRYAGREGDKNREG